MRTKTLKREKEKACKAFQRWVVMRDCDAYQKGGMCAPCVSCNRIKHYNDLQGGHFKAGRGNAILFEETNCHAQCRHCNGHLRYGLTFEEVEHNYREAMLKKIGVKEVMRIERLKGTTRKYKTEEFTEIFELYRKKMIELGGPTFVLPKF